MAVKSINELLNISKLNSVKQGKLIEIARGTEEIEKELNGRINQVTGHIFYLEDRGGNHYHKEKIEVMTILEGEILVCLMDIDSKIKMTQMVSAGHRFTLPLGFAHALYNPKPEKVYMLEFSNLRFNPENPMNDVYKYSVL